MSDDGSDIMLNGLIDKIRNQYINESIRRGTMGELGASDDERLDVYVCEECSAKFGAIAWHEIKDDPHATEKLYYAGKLNVREQTQLLKYEIGLTQTNAVNFFLIRGNIEQYGRTSVNKFRWFKPGTTVAQLFSTELVSIGTDATDCPMFDIEIDGWVKSFREFKNFPLRNHPMFEGHITLREMMMFAMYYEKQYRGFVMQLICGPLQEDQQFLKEGSNGPVTSTEEVLFDIAKDEAARYFRVPVSEIEEMLVEPFKGWDFNVEL